VQVDYDSLKNKDVLQRSLLFLIGSITYKHPIMRLPAPDVISIFFFECKLTTSIMHT
jgi:hypothetical protein